MWLYGWNASIDNTSFADSKQSIWLKKGIQTIKYRCTKHKTFGIGRALKKKTVCIWSALEQKSHERVPWDTMPQNIVSEQSAGKVSLNTMDLMEANFVTNTA